MWDQFINSFDNFKQIFVDAFSSIASFFNSLIDTIWSILEFLWSAIKFMWYGIKTVLLYIGDVIDYIFWLSFWTDLFGFFRNLSMFIGVDVIYLVLMVFVAIMLVIFTFISRLLLWKLSFLNKPKD